VETAIPLTMVYQRLQESSAKFKLMFYEACHSGRLGTRNGAVAPPDLLAPFPVTAEGWSVFAACKEDEYAVEDPALGHGLFSYFLVKGLGGDAADQKGEVT